MGRHACTDALARMHARTHTHSRKPREGDTLPRAVITCDWHPGPPATWGFRAHPYDSGLPKISTALWAIVYSLKNNKNNDCFKEKQREG